MKTDPLIKNGHLTARTTLASKSGSRKRYTEVRFCIRDDCDIKLSSYNKGPYCYSHSTVYYPRVRGVVKSDQ